MPKPLLSIITVTYNAESAIEKTIKSVITQRFENFEYIVIDGQSTDNTLSILKKYEDRISRLVVEKDKGIYDAMNKGLRYANGEFVTFLNSGDYYVDENVLSQVSNYLNQKNKLVYGDSIVFSEKRKFSKYLKSRIITNKSIRRDFPACHQSMFVKKSAANFYDLSYRIKADYKWLVDIVSKASNDELCKINVPIVYYSIEGFSHKQFKKNLKELALLHYREFGITRVLLNFDIYAFRILRHLKDLATSG